MAEVSNEAQCLQKSAGARRHGEGRGGSAVKERLTKLLALHPFFSSTSIVYIACSMICD